MNEKKKRLDKYLSVLELMSVIENHFEGKAEQSSLNSLTNLLSQHLHKSLNKEASKNSTEESRQLNDFHCVTTHCEELASFLERIKSLLVTENEGQTEKTSSEAPPEHSSFLHKLNFVNDPHLMNLIQNYFTNEAFFKLAHEQMDHFNQPLQKSIEGLKALLEKEPIQNDHKKQTEKNTNHPSDFFSALKKTGFALEYQLNQQIQDFLNNEKLIHSSQAHADWLAWKLQSFQKHIEGLSTLLLIPTKNDVANVAKLTLQTEEKVDKLEEHLLDLTESIKKLIREENLNPSDNKG